MSSTTFDWMNRGRKSVKWLSKLEMINELKAFDTPTITNVVATYPDTIYVLGCTIPGPKTDTPTKTVRCMYPELGRTFGYAVTCVYGLPDPGYNNLSFEDVVEALEKSPKPSIFVLQQKFPPELAGKVGLSCGNMISAMMAMGCVGAISNGPSRDIDETRNINFHYILSSATAGHGEMAVHAVNVPVSASGMDVEPGEITHMNENGA